MSRPIVHVEPDGPIVEVVPNVNVVAHDRRELKVGLIARPVPGRGWVELTPDQARAVAAALIRAARETES